ncbi:hypothetical protein C8R43DRAFT_1208638 [Mycena crocata]|nr:hypothetical protein C8R43DRAFT_1208638 [Mycena crocata]
MRASVTLVSIVALLGSGFSRAQSPSESELITCTPSAGPVSAARQRVIFENFIDLVYKNATVETVREAWKHIAADEIQHNPAALDGANTSFAIVSVAFTDPTHKIQIINQAFESPVGWVHFRFDGINPEPTAVVDMYRFNEACIVEHWDVIQERPVNATSQHPLF